MSAVWRSTRRESRATRWMGFVWVFEGLGGALCGWLMEDGAFILTRRLLGRCGSVRVFMCAIMGLGADKA